MRMGVKGSAKAEGYTLLPRDIGKWLTLLKAQMNLRVPWNARYFLSSRASQDGLCSRALNLKLAMSLAKHVMFICRNEQSLRPFFFLGLHSSERYSPTISKLICLQISSQFQCQCLKVRVYRFVHRTSSNLIFPCSNQTNKIWPLSQRGFLTQQRPVVLCVGWR